MGAIDGFKTYQREVAPDRPIGERIRDWREIPLHLAADALTKQGARCMDCGIPFCHTGCPLGNVIPDFNDLVYQNRWQVALERLHATNNFPEFTGRVCPAPCESACVLGLVEPPVTIKQIEKAIADRGWEEGWIVPEPPQTRTGKKVAVIGSGPAGLACAQQLNRAGHWVTVFERADRAGGLLAYGIPDFKLEKKHIERRVQQMEEEGIVFQTGIWVGVDLAGEKLLNNFDAVCLTGGSTKARDMDVPGRQLKGVHLAMEFLTQQNRLSMGQAIRQGERIGAHGKHVVVIGGGDTGSDCVGTATRQGALSVTQLELLPKPPEARPQQQPWPYYPMILRTSTSHEEGCERYWSISTRNFTGENGEVRALHAVRLEWIVGDGGRMQMQETAGSDFTLPAELVLLAMGFTGPEKEGLIEQLAIELDERGNVKTDGDYRTSRPGVFAAGDMRRGQSLVVWALSEGREAARAIDVYLMGCSSLPVPGTQNESLPRR